MSTPSTEAKSFADMDDDQFRTALRGIITTSQTTDEVHRRLADELGYPYLIAITSHRPTDALGCEARELVVALGGCTLASGEMVMIMAHGPSGKVINL